MQYRKDIQILRGLAVSLVVLFHMEIGGFASGFLGVDIFFVISGYLMAVKYDPARKREFFTSRAKRLLPAYFALVLVTLAICLARTTPNDFNQVARQVLFATAFIPNVGFWLEKSYFDKAAFKPLLHLWSLGVEMQFYLLVPLLFGLFSRVRGSFVFFLLGSIGACFFVLSISPKTSFFWLPFRLWEFLFGYAVATHGTKIHENNSTSRSWTGVAALAVLLCIPILEIDGKALGYRHGHPGIYALCICIATALVLRAGLPNWLQSLRIATGFEMLGRYSYSIYLAHFPAIVLFLYQPFEGTILGPTGMANTFQLTILICVASALIYRFVEKPFRTGVRIRAWVFGAALAVVALGPAGAAFQRATIPEKEMLIYQAWEDRSEYRCGKIRRLLNPGALSCEITDPLESPARRMLLVGDSHSDSIKSTFATVAHGRNVSVWFMVENNPLSAGGTNADALVKEAKSRKVESIVLHYAPGGIALAVVEQLVRLAKANGLRVALLLPVPIWEEHVPKSMWKHMMLGIPPKDNSVSAYQMLNQAFIEGVKKIDTSYLVVYQTIDVLCQDKCKRADDDGRPLFFDHGHLTLTGSKLLWKTFDRLLSHELNH